MQERIRNLLNIAAIWFIIVWWLGIGCLLLVDGPSEAPDFNHFWTGSRTFLDGGNPYLRFYSYPDGTPTDNDQFLHFPWVALAFVPLALLPFSGALKLWLMMNLLALAGVLGMIFVLLRAKLKNGQIFLVETATLVLALRSLYLGQLSLFLTLFALLVLFCWEKRRDVLAGIFLSWLVLKPWVPGGMLLGIFLMTVLRKRWKVLVAWISNSALIVLGTTIAWPGWWRTFRQVDFLGALGYRSGETFSVYWPVATWADYLRFAWHVDLPEQVQWVIWIVLLVMVGLLGWQTIDRWRNLQVDDNFLAGTFLVLGLLLLPYLRFYDYFLLAVWMVSVAPVLRKSQCSRACKYFLLSAGIAVGMATVIGMGMQRFTEALAFQVLVVAYGITWIVVSRSAQRETAV